LALGRFALAFGRVRFAFFFALGFALRRATFFRFRTAVRLGFRTAISDSPAIGEGEGADGMTGIDDGIIGSIIPGPVQPLSEKSVCWRIRVSPPLVVGGRGLIA
jgi:hypothetical protein